MNRELALGLNRTGIKASPADARELLESLELHDGLPQPDPMIPASGIRADYLQTADPLGSVPPPTTLRGVLGSVTQALGGHRLHLLLDKLGERAAYERSGARLYEAAMRKFLSMEKIPAGMDMAGLQEIHDEELRHFALLRDAIETLGGDPTTQTPCANAAAVQSMGLLQSVNDPRTSGAQTLQALLAAELIDVASWELLVELAHQFGLDEMAQSFRDALVAENRHLERVRNWLSEILSAVATGQA